MTLSPRRTAPCYASRKSKPAISWNSTPMNRSASSRWASRQWIIDLLHNPAHERFYGKNNDRMPAYGEKGELSPAQIGMIVDWLRGEAR